MSTVHTCVLCEQERNATFAFAEDKEGVGLRVCWLCLRSQPWDRAVLA